MNLFILPKERINLFNHFKNDHQHEYFRLKKKSLNKSTTDTTGVDSATNDTIANGSIANMVQ